MKRSFCHVTLMMSLLCLGLTLPATAQTPLLEVDYHGATIFHVLSDGAVTSDVTLTGDGTPGSPLGVSVPLVLTGGTGSGGTVYGEHIEGHRGLLGGEFSGVFGLHSNGNIGELGSSNYGAYGFSNTGTGVYGAHSDGNYGFLGSPSFGVFGESIISSGVFGRTTTGYGVRGQNDNGDTWGALGTNNFAGFFDGNVFVIGTLSKSGGSFKIDHPLDPEGKYLSHSFVESPDMMNVYNGNVITDANGEAVVVLPDYFETLNRDFRYQLTTIGGFAPVYIAEKIVGNQFKIAGGTPGMEVSWQVTGIRQDAWANEHRIVVEEDKPADERGFYLNPSVFGQQQERSVMWVQHPEAMRSIQEPPAGVEEQ